MTPTIKIEIVSDPVCPWCYIGKRRLEKALAVRPKLNAGIRWLPFQLSPDMPRAGKDRAEHYASIFGAERAKAINARMAEMGKTEGIGFQLKPGARSPNTLAAHVLMYWAGHTPGVDANALAEKLFAAHHVACEDLSDPAVLERIAGEVGMDRAEVRRRLDAREDEDKVQALIAQAREMGVTGVPFFVFNRRYAVSGAQPPEAIVELLDKLVTEAG
jgi:predicted DsbA family dithiol-disulfide isomerase